MLSEYKVIREGRTGSVIQERSPGNIESGAGDAFNWLFGESCPRRIFGCHWRWYNVRAWNKVQSAKWFLWSGGTSQSNIPLGVGGLTIDSAWSTKTSAIMWSFDASVFRRPMASRNTGSSLMAANDSTLSRREELLLSSICPNKTRNGVKGQHTNCQTMPLYTSSESETSCLSR